MRGISKKKPGFFKNAKVRVAPTSKDEVPSLLGVMQAGQEYGSLLDKRPTDGLNLRDEIRKSISEVEALRGRPLLIYAANMVKPPEGVATSIVTADDLPFAEMVSMVPSDVRDVDILLVTPGGLGHQVAKFVSRLRPRFDSVAFILPSDAMSAGTLWALSGDELLMDERAALGPIDPQVAGREGRLLPAQALMVLVDQIRQRGEARLANGEQPLWTDVVLLRNIDAKELGDAYSATRYSAKLASDSLKSGALLANVAAEASPTDREIEALRIATMLANHGGWNAHAHGIDRNTAAGLGLKVTHLENRAELGSAVRRLWALLYWAFDNSVIAKVLLSQQYALFRSGKAPGGAQ